jgi:hypothetical protein
MSSQALSIVFMIHLAGFAFKTGIMILSFFFFFFKKKKKKKEISPVSLNECNISMGKDAHYMSYLNIQIKEISLRKKHS